MVHTISGNTQHRLRRMAVAGDTPWAAREVTERMDARVGEVDPFSFDSVGCERRPLEQLPEITSTKPNARGEAFYCDFDRQLNGRVSRLVDWSPNAEETVAEAVRTTFSLTREELSDDEAIARVLDPARNRYRLEVMNVSYHSPLMRSLHHA